MEIVHSFNWFKQKLENSNFRFTDSSELFLNKISYTSYDIKYQKSFDNSEELKGHLLDILRSRNLDDLGI